MTVCSFFLWKASTAYFDLSSFRRMSLFLSFKALCSCLKRYFIIYCSPYLVAMCWLYIVLISRYSRFNIFSFYFSWCSNSSIFWSSPSCFDLKKSVQTVLTDLFRFPILVRRCSIIYCFMSNPDFYFSWRDWIISSLIKISSSSRFLRNSLI